MSGIIKRWTQYPARENVFQKKRKEVFVGSHNYSYKNDPQTFLRTTPKTDSFKPFFFRRKSSIYIYIYCWGSQKVIYNKGCKTQKIFGIDCWGCKWISAELWEKTSPPPPKKKKKKWTKIRLEKCWSKISHKNFENFGRKSVTKILKNFGRKLVTKILRILVENQ